ncbi:4'-phosphopantetheinyl transferase, partial [Brucella abortus]
AVMPGRGDDHAPIWPPGMVGSISHSKGCAIAVAARQSRYLGLGIDIERLQTESSARKIAPQILGESELRQLPEAGRAFLVSLAFSAKESLFKALYPAVQQFQSFHAAAFSFDGDRQQACLELAVDWSAQWRRGQRFPIRFFCRDGFILTCTAIAAISCRSEMSG